jgi:hypothetical protein
VAVSFIGGGTEVLEKLYHIMLYRVGKNQSVELLACM